MSFVTSHKSLTVKSELDLFTVKPTQNSIENGTVHEYRPVSILDSNSPIEFNIAPSDEYVDLSQTQIYIRATITEDNNKTLAAGDTVVPVNNFINSMFDHVSLELNSKTVTPPSNSYAMRSYFETLLNYSADAKKTHLTSRVYVKDLAGQMDSATSSSCDARKAMMKNGKVEMTSFIHSELMSQNKLLLNGVGMTFRFFRSKSGFALLKTSTDEKNYKITINEAILYIRRVKVNPSIMMAHAKTLEYGNAKYCVNRVEMKTITVPAGLQTKTLDNIVIGQLPKRLFLAMVDSKALNDDITRNPFNFQHFNVNHVGVTTDSNINILPIKCKFGNEQFIQGYNSIFSSTGIHFADQGNNITRKDYANGYTIFGFDLTEDLAASEAHWSLPRTGSMRIDLMFDKALKDPISVILYLEYDNIIEIDKFRNVILDYAS